MGQSGSGSTGAQGTTQGPLSTGRASPPGWIPGTVVDPLGSFGVINNSSGTGYIGGTPPATADSAPIATVNTQAPASATYGPPPGNNPYDWFTGQLFQNGQGSQGGPGAIPNSAFGGDWLQSLFPMLTGLNYPGPVPTALAPYGTQSSLFGDLTGLGNPLLLPMLLLMANRPTTSVPFDPPVQPGSPDQNNGVWPWLGTNPFFPTSGSTLPPWVTPPFQQVPPVPGGASNLPGNLPPIGHGPFQPGQLGFGPEEGGPGEGMGDFGVGSMSFTAPNWAGGDKSGFNQFMQWLGLGGGPQTSFVGQGPSDPVEQHQRAQTVANNTGAPVAVRTASGQTHVVQPYMGSMYTSENTRGGDT